MSNWQFNLFSGGFVTIYQEIFSAGCMSGWLCGIGLLSSSPKVLCPSVELLVYPQMGPVPFLFLIGHSDFLNLPSNFFVVSYSCFMFLLAAALSVSSANPSTKSRLSVLTFSSLLYIMLLCALSGPLPLLPLCCCCSLPLLVFSKLYLPNRFRLIPVFLLWFPPANYLYTFFFFDLRHYFLAWVLILQLQGGDQKQRLHLSLPARLVAIFGTCYWCR